MIKTDRELVLAINRELKLDFVDEKKKTVDHDAIWEMFGDLLCTKENYDELREQTDAVRKFFNL